MRINLYFLNKIKCLIIITIGISLAAGCSLKKETLFSGNTMGTTYHVKVVSDYFAGVSHLDQKIKLCLEGINHSMSTYQKDSEISRFNALKDPAKPFKSTHDFYAVMTMAQDLYLQTEGAWDGTIDPLVRLWGFGRDGMQYQIPEKEKIEKKLAQVGFDKIELLADQTLKKGEPAVKVDLASIAKGFGVDQVARLLRKNHITDFLVEIGGEIYASGRRKDGEKWQVGINQPRKNAPLDAIYTVVEIENQAFATSGDYRNYIEINGKRYSHIIDPRTGWPVDNGVVSVSVLADNCAFADGLATAIMVMGAEKGLALLNQIKSVEGLILIANSDDNIKAYASTGFHEKPTSSTENK